MEDGRKSKAGIQEICVRLDGILMEGGRAKAGDLRCTFDVVPRQSFGQCFVAPSMIQQRICHSIASNFQASNGADNLPCKVHHETCSQGKVLLGIFGIGVRKGKLNVADTWNPV